MTEQKKKDHIFDLIISKDFDEARNKGVDYFGDDEDKALAWFFGGTVKWGELAPL